MKEIMNSFDRDDRTPEGFYRLKEGSGFDNCVKRAIAYAPHADLIWMETSVPKFRGCS